MLQVCACGYGRWSQQIRRNGGSLFYVMFALELNCFEKQTEITVFKLFFFFFPVLGYPSLSTSNQRLPEDWSTHSTIETHNVLLGMWMTEGVSVSVHWCATLTHKPRDANTYANWSISQPLRKHRWFRCFTREIILIWDQDMKMKQSLNDQSSGGIMMIMQS